MRSYVVKPCMLHVSRVNRFQGLFYFDSSFRPVPLEQHFIGVRGKARSETSKRNMDQAVFDKVAENLAAGHQVMVFVHARKETVKTAEKLKEMALTEGAADDFDPRNHPQFDFFRKEIGTSRNKEMKQLFDYGFGIHHAGMLRSDRNMIERMFEANCIKVSSRSHEQVHPLPSSCKPRPLALTFCLVPFDFRSIIRFWCVQQLLLGVSTCQHMRLSSRAPTYMMQERVVSSTCRSWMFFRWVLFPLICGKPQSLLTSPPCVDLWSSRTSWL